MSSLLSSSRRQNSNRNARGQRTRATILSCARAILETEGFDRLSMAAVAERARISRRAMYLHFASRSDLVAAVFDSVTETEGLDASLAAVWSSPDAAAALDAWARHFARFHPRVMDATRAVERVYRQDADAAAHRDRYLSEQLTACRRLADWLEREHRLAPGWSVETAAEMLWGLISLDMLDRLLIQQAWTEERLANQLSLLLRSTFLAQQDGPTVVTP